MPENKLKNFDLEKFLPYRLSLLSNRISGAIAESYRHSHQISMTEWRLIAVLGQYPGCTATDLRAYTAMDKVTISRSLKQLLQRGLIVRSEHDTDGRSRQLHLTGAGEKLRAEVIPRALDCEARLTAVLSREETRQFRQLIDRLLAAP